MCCKLIGRRCGIFSLVVEVRDDLTPYGTNGCIYYPEKHYLFAIRPKLLRSPIAACLTEIYGNSKPPIKMLVQFDRASGRYNIEYEDNDPTRFAWEWTDRSVPRGKYCLKSRLVFSFDPRCHGDCGSQK